MKMYAKAGLSLKGRELLIDRVEKVGWWWLVRYRADGRDGL